MSLYAKINSDNIVENVIVCEDSQISTLSGTYVKVTDQTNDPYQGYGYSSILNRFESPKPYDSWTLNEETLVWESPDGPKPSDGFYRWNEETLNWETLS
jgi:hypothetical protein